MAFNNLGHFTIEPGQTLDLINGSVARAATKVATTTVPNTAWRIH